MIVALVILIVIAFFVTMYFYRSKNPQPLETNTTRVSGGRPQDPPTPGQTSQVSSNPGSVPDGTGHDKGEGNSAMSSGMQG